MLKRSCAILFLAAMLPLSANAQQTVYSNGSINGTTDAWTINSGFVVSDTFTVPIGGAPVDELEFGAWAFPGDVLESAEVSITSSEFGGTAYSDQIVNFTQSGCSGNQYGFNVCTETGIFAISVNLVQGTYWLNLSNAVVNSGDSIYWDENSGPSSASESSVGTIPSEAFTILGRGQTCGLAGINCTTTTYPPSVPEPGSLLLFASGIFAVPGFSRLWRGKRF